MFFSNFEDLLRAIQNGDINANQGMSFIVKNISDMRREATDVQKRICNIIEYLYWKGEKTYAIRYDINPSVYIVFPEGIKSGKIYKKLFDSNLIHEKQNESILLLVYPIYKRLFDILMTILLSH